MRWRGVFGKRRKEVARVYAKNVEWDLGGREKESRGWQRKVKNNQRKRNRYENARRKPITVLLFKT